MREGVGRVFVILLINLRFEDRGCNEGNSDQFLVCAWGAHDGAVAGTAAGRGGRVGRGSGLGWARARGGRGGGGVGGRGRDGGGGMADTYLKDVVVVVLFGGG